jgi:hypothetical protein
MDRTTGANNIDIGGGRRGFRSKDTVPGLPGTRVTAAWLNDIQEEMALYIEAAGLVLAAGDQTQLRRAARKQAGNMVAPLSVAGTANDVTLGFTPAFANRAETLFAPMRFAFEAANTGPMRVNVDGIGLVDLRWPDNTPLAAGETFAGLPGVIIDDGVNFKLFTPLSPTQVRALTAPLNRSQIFTASGTFIVPAGVTSAEVIVIGGGGGGGASANGSGGGTVGNIGAGGGAGGYALRRTTGLTPGASVTVTVGAAGTAPAAASGGAGGSSSFGAFVSATGGGGGGWGENTLSSGGAGGNGSGGDLNVQGGDGGFGGNNAGGGSTATQSDVLRIYGRGGVAAGGYSIPTFGGTGGAGRGHGTGGSGASGGSGVAGGAGTPGIVIVRW